MSLVAANTTEHRWAVILPTSTGQERFIPIRPGTHEPGSFADRRGREPLIQDAIFRVRRVVDPQNICVILDRDRCHDRWSLASMIPISNLLVQPRNCGTAVGILFAVLEILDRDPFAQVIIVPAEHRFENEMAVTVALRCALDRVANGSLELALVAVEAHRPATELAYVVPGGRLREGVYKVKEFLDKPDIGLARQLCDRGSLCSTFLCCAWGFSLLALLREHLPTISDAMSTALAQLKGPSRRADALVELFDQLPTVDFSSTVLRKSRSMIQVIHVTNCGWSDLSSPQNALRSMGNYPTTREEYFPRSLTGGTRAGSRELRLLREAPAQDGSDSNRADQQADPVSQLP